MLNRKLKMLAAAAIAVALGYAASPYVAAARFAHDLAASDSRAAVARIDMPAVRASIAGQVARALIAKNPQIAGRSPFGPQAAGAVVGGFVNAYLAETFPPDVVTRMLQDGRLPASLQQTGPDTALPSFSQIGDIATLLRRAGFAGITAFDIALPGPDRDGRLRFRLRGTTWRLTAMALPESALDKLVTDIDAKLRLAKPGE